MERKAWRYDLRIFYKYYLYCDISLQLISFSHWYPERHCAISLVHRLLVVAGIIYRSGYGFDHLIANRKQKIVHPRAPSFLRKTSKTTAFPMVYGYHTIWNDWYPWSRTLIWAHIYPRYREWIERSWDLFSRNRRNAIRFVFLLRLLLRETAKDFRLCSPERGCCSSIISKRRFFRFFFFLSFSLCIGNTLPSTYVFGNVALRRYVCTRCLLRSSGARKISPRFTSNERWASIFTVARIGFIP